MRHILTVRGACAAGSGVKIPLPRRPQAGYRRGGTDRFAARTIAPPFEGVGCALRCCPVSWSWDGQQERLKKLAPFLDFRILKKQIF